MPWGVSLREQRKGFFDPLLYRKHPELYRHYIASLPRMYYAVFASLTVAAWGAATQRPLVLAASLLAWLRKRSENAHCQPLMGRSSRGSSV